MMLPTTIKPCNWYPKSYISEHSMRKGNYHSHMGAGYQHTDGDGAPQRWHITSESETTAMQDLFGKVHIQMRHLQHISLWPSNRTTLLERILRQE